MSNRFTIERKCPGTKYNLSLAICKGRQQVNYPKCTICEHKDNNIINQTEPNIEFSVNMGIFKGDDIRGVYPNEINEHVAQRIGVAFARFLKEQNPKAKTIVIGRDMRPSSRSLAAAIIDGITSIDINAVNIGIVSTDIIYFAVGYYKFDAGIMITASHYPNRYNGFKMCREDATPIIYDSGLSTIAQLVSLAPPISSEQLGMITEKDVFNDYKAFILSFVEQLRPLKIAIDTGNGMAGKIIPLIFKELPCEVVPLYFELDGNFPNHEPHPLDPKNLVDLQEKVRQTKAHLGAAFDGDGDSCIFVDENGNVVRGDLITAVIARELLTKERGAKIAYDLCSSRVVPEEIKASAGMPIRGKAGHSHIKTCMREENAIFAGETSGHYFYRDNYYSDSAIITLIKILNILCKKNVPLSNLIAPFKRYYSTGTIDFEVPDRDLKIRQLAERFPDGKIDTLDGITVEYNDWWFNLRKSYTEPKLRLMIEAGTKKILDEVSGLVTGLIKKR